MVERVAHLVHEFRYHAGRGEAAHLLPQTAVHHGGGGVQAHTPQLVTQRVGHLKRRAHRIVLVIHEHDHVQVGRVAICKSARRKHGVAAIRSDEPMGHGAHAPAAPPRCLGIGAHADGAGHVRGPAITGLHLPVIESGGEVQDGLAVGGLNHGAHVAADQRAPAQYTQHQGLKVCKQRVVALNAQHRFPRGDLVAVKEGLHLNGVTRGLPSVGGAVPCTERHDGDGLINPAQHRVLALEHLHQHPRVVVVGLQHLACKREVGVAVVPVAHALNGQLKCGRSKPRPIRGGAQVRSSGPSGGRSRGRDDHTRPTPASATRLRAMAMTAGH